MSGIRLNKTTRTRKIIFLILPQMHILDFAGPCQVFYEASQLGALPLQMHFVSFQPDAMTQQGLWLTQLESPDHISLHSNDLIVVPGIDYDSFQRGDLHDALGPSIQWLQEKQQLGIPIASICSGAMILAAAGILNGRQATSHWKCLDQLRRDHPSVKVKQDCLFVKDHQVYTSAGMSSGIDMCLAIVEEWYGPVLASRTAREMVIFLRRNKDHNQETVYLDYQSHYNSAIHRVQNYLISHPEKNPSLAELAAQATMSERNLTRMFKEVTGHTITQFKHRLKLELVKGFLHNPDLTIEAIAQRCGYQDARQLRRIWKEEMGTSLRQSRLG